MRGLFIASGLVAMVSICGCSVPYNLIRPPQPLFEDANVTAQVSGPASANGAGSSTSAPAPTGPTSVSAYMFQNFNRTLNAAKESDQDAAVYEKAINEGMGLIDYNCTVYFRLLGKAAQEIGFTRKETSLAGGVVSAMLGLANQTPKVIANTGAIFGFSTASMDTYQDVYLFSPDVAAVESLVIAEMKRIRKEQATAGATSWGDIVSVLPRYESVCQPHGIRRLINESLATKTESLKKDTNGGGG